MSGLQEAVEQYVALRRSLGFKLREPATILKKVVAFAEEQGASYLTIDLMLRWASERSSAQPATKAAWLAMVRRFALWRRASDPRTEVPAENLLPLSYRRQRPYIYTDDELNRLVEAASRLPSCGGVRGLTYSTFFALLAATGMRLSEGLALDRADVDLDEGILTVRLSKFGKSRLVPVHSSTRDALRRYAEKRDHILGRVSTPAFFLSESGTRITNWSSHYNFARVSQQIGLRPPATGYRHGRGPRIHDLRHRFAVRTLINWYRAGLDVERELPKLSTYLGHAHVNDTYWYIEAVPELLQLATDRLIERHEEATA